MPNPLAKIFARTVSRVMWLVWYLPMSDPYAKAYGQTTTPQVVLSQEPPATPQAVRLFYDGSSRLQYMCKAHGWKTQSQYAVTAGSLVNIAVSSGVATVTTSAAHGVLAEAQIRITGSSSSLMNRKATVASVTSTTMVLAGVFEDGTYSSGNSPALTVTTTFPKTSQAIWTVTKHYYDGSGNLTDVKTSEPNQICDNRAATGSLQIAYQ